MATIREIKPGEDEAKVFAEMDNQSSQVSTDDEYDSDDDIYDEDDDEELEEDFKQPGIFSKIKAAQVFVTEDRISSEGSGGIRIPSFCHDDDDSLDSECGHCTCDKHKKILSFMDACVKLGFQLLSSDFEKSFKPLQNAFHSSQKCTPIKQLNGVALSVKRVCNYALEQSCSGYIEKFKKFIQKEMIDTDYEHIEFLIEMHFEMKENFDCYSKNFILLLAIANQLNPAYSEAVLFRVSSKSFKESQAIDRFLKTQEDIKSALIHYEKVLNDIKQKFDEQHQPNLEMPPVPDTVRKLMNGSPWVAYEFDSKFNSGTGTELESSSEHIDLTNFELELEQEARQAALQNPNNATSGNGKKSSTRGVQNDISGNSGDKVEKGKKVKRKGAQSRLIKGDISPCDQRSGSLQSTNRNGSHYSNPKVKEKLLKTVHHTSVNIERSFKVKFAPVKKSKLEKVNSCSSSREQSNSSTRQSDANGTSKVSSESKLKNSCAIRNFECCENKIEPQNETANNVTIVDEKNEHLENHSNDQAYFESFETSDSDHLYKIPNCSLKAEDYLDDSDEIGLEDMSEFITVNNKRNQNRNRAQKNTGFGDVQNVEASVKRNDSVHSDDFSVNSNQDFKLGMNNKNRNNKFDRNSNSNFVFNNSTHVFNGIDASTAKIPSATTNAMTVTQKMQALMSSDPKPHPIIATEPTPEHKKLTTTLSMEDISFKGDFFANNRDVKSGAVELGSGGFDGAAIGTLGSTAVSKPKPICKPIATVDPCKSDKPSVVTTSAKSLDKWNSAGLFTTETTIDFGNNGSAFSNEECPIYQGYSPFNGSDRLRPVQDSMALYTKSTNLTSKPNDFENSIKEPITSNSSQVVFSAGFSNGDVYSGIYSMGKMGTGSPFSTEPPGFDLTNDLLKYSMSSIVPNDYNKHELSPDMDLKSNLNPTASVFNPGPGSKDFFPSANPPSEIFHRSNSTPETPFPPSKTSLPSLLASGLANNPPLPSRARVEENTSKFFPVKGSTQKSRIDFLRLYKEHMHMHLKLVMAELNDSKSKLFLLTKLKKFSTHLEDVEIGALISEITSRIDSSKDNLDRIYCSYKHNIMILSSSDSGGGGILSYDQLLPIEVNNTVPPPSVKYQRVFSNSFQSNHFS